MDSVCWQTVHEIDISYSTSSHISFCDAWSAPKVKIIQVISFDNQRIVHSMGLIFELTIFKDTHERKNFKCAD